MTKRELMAIAEKYSMDFIREEITREGCGIYKISGEPIAELDRICERTMSSTSELPVAGECFHVCEGAPYTYRIFCPRSWIDLWGWC